MKVVIHNYRTQNKLSVYRIGWNDAQKTGFIPNAKWKFATFGTDSAGETGKVLPVTNVVTQIPLYIIGTEPTFDGLVELVDIENAVITTDNIKITDLPVISELVFLQNDGTLGATNTNNSPHAIGVCIPLVPNFNRNRYRTIKLFKIKP